MTESGLTLTEQKILEKIGRWVGHTPQHFIFFYFLSYREEIEMRVTQKGIDRMYVPGYSTITHNDLCVIGCFVMDWRTMIVLDVRTVCGNHTV